MIARKLVLAMLAVGLGFISSALQLGGPFAILHWPGATFCAIALLYVHGDGRLLGKRRDGRLRAVVVAALLPYFALAWIVWHVKRLVSSERAFDEVAPGLFLGRRVYAGELPEATALVVDLTAEFAEPAGVREGRRYLAVPTLDGAAPREAQLLEAVREVAGSNERAFIHCALGHGRSALVAAGVLVARGLAKDGAEAEAQLRAKRPLVRLSGPQRRLLARVLEQLREPA